MPSTKDWIIWGSELSPFTLKLLRLYRQTRVPFRFLPAEGSRWEVIRYALRRELLVRGVRELTWPEFTREDEFPLVPFVFGPDGENLYDSSAISDWLDRGRDPAVRFTPEDPALRFLVRLIDEYADEWGLYLVHHNRWKVSALDNDAGTRVAREFSALLGPLQASQARRFAARQTRRLPYLFSVAPAGFHIDGLPAERQPPARAGFPATHDLLEDAFLRLLHALEPLFARSPFLLGGRMTLADASLYGELGMNLSDPAANRIMERTAPALHAWLSRMHANEIVVDTPGSLRLDIEGLKPLIAEIRRTFLPLMRQNYAHWKPMDERLLVDFNEHAFNRGKGLYDGEINGHPFRHVVKSFQAKVWRRLCVEWRALPASAHDQLSGLGLDDGCFSA